jgi:hypothetical protein
MFKPRPTTPQTETPTAPVVQPTKEKLYYEEVRIPLKRGIEYHFFGCQCQVKPKGYDPMGQTIPFINLYEEGGYTIFKLDPPDDVPEEQYWIYIQCVNQSNTTIGNFEKTIYEDGNMALFEWRYIENDSIRFFIWWLEPR